MKISVLVDNTTLKHTYGEWGASHYIEDNEVRILFDLGRTDLFLKNANKLKIDLFNTQYVALSHGHFDHTHGIIDLIRFFSLAENDNIKKPQIIAHPITFEKRVDLKDRENGTNITANELKTQFDVIYSEKPFYLTDKLIFLGEIERKNDYEGKKVLGKIEQCGIMVDDYFVDDTALVYKTDDGIVIVAGCAHSGICNIIEYAKKVCNDERVIDVVGGFHLLECDTIEFYKTIEYFKNSNIRQIHPCHCTNLQAKIELSKVVDTKETGVGLVLEY